MDQNDIVWRNSLAGSKLDLSEFNVSFRDEFNSLSIAGAGKPGTWYSGARTGFGLASFANPDSAISPFSVVNGVLDIRMQQVGGKWQSGLLQSVDANGAGFSQTYGYFEMKAQFPSGAGAWPGFWLISEGHDEQPRVEIDVVEAYSGDPTGHHTALHYTGTASTPDISGHIWKSDYTGLPTSMFDNGFHTYGTMVTPEWIITYFDGVELTRTSSTKYINTPFYMIVDLAMTEHGVKDPNAVYDMKVDYIRAYADPSITAQNLKGTAAADVLVGSNFNDTLDGGAGGDTLKGGKGNDTYYVDNIADRVIEAWDAGTDQVISSVSFDMRGQYIEKLKLVGDGNTSAFGTKYDNQITGNAGSNIINGGGGRDVMSGGLGDDSYYVDNIADRVIEAGNQGIDTVFTSISFDLGGQYTEKLVATGAVAISLIGNSLDNTLTANNAGNILDGKLGADTMIGGAGTDKLSGGDGKDKLIGGHGIDTLTGGGNSDTFVFNTALNASTNRDIVTDFSHVDDTFQLENAVFAKLGAAGALNPAFLRAGAAASDANDYIVYNRANGVLSYDSNGNAAGGAIAFAVLTNKPVLAADDFVVI